MVPKIRKYNFLKLKLIINKQLFYEQLPKQNINLNIGMKKNIETNEGHTFKGGPRCPHHQVEVYTSQGDTMYT